MANKSAEFTEWTTVGVVRSKTTAGVEYQVKKRHVGEWKCNCLGNQHGHVCWHMRASWALGMMAKEAGVASIASPDGRVIVMRTEAF